MIYLPDTNAVSLYLRGHDKGLNERMTKNWKHLRLSTLVIAEREYGIIRHKSGLKYRDRFQSLVSLLPIEVFNREDTANYAELRYRLEKRGKSIDPMDTLIAAQALRLGATVVTHNLSEFKRVPKLKVIDWQTSRP